MFLVKAKQKTVPKKLLTMTKMLIALVIRKWMINLRFFGRRKSLFLVLPLMVCLLLLWPSFWWFARDIIRILLPPSPKHSLQAVRMNRSLENYIKHTEILIKPNHTPCKYEESVLIMVASAPDSSDRRQALRETWARFQPTYFVLGVINQEELACNTEEAKVFDDLLVFSFQDHYQNQTLKTALMMKWKLAQCPKAQFLFITLDDVLVNPWTLNEIILENSDAQLIGYIKNDINLRKYTYNKWYIPETLREAGVVPKYLSGTGYLINGEYVEPILKTAYQVQIFNLEDIYFTYLVAYKKLGFDLRHDRRLSPYKPWLNIGCVYWGLASIHSLAPLEMVAAWIKLENLVLNHNDVAEVCKYLDFHTLNDLIMY